MSADPSNRKTSLIDIFRAVAAIVGVPLALFALSNGIVANPILALVVALITAALASACVVQSGWTGTTEVVVAWLALIVVVLVGFVIFPKTMKVEGIIRDPAGNLVSNEKVMLFDRSGRRYETKTNTGGYYQFTDVPTGNYRIQVGGTEVEGATEGLLVSKVQQNIVALTTVTSTLTALPTPTPAPSPTTPIATPINTLEPIPTATPTNTSKAMPTTTPTNTPSPTLTATPTNTPTPTPSFQNFERNNGTPLGANEEEESDYFWDAWFMDCSFSEEIIREGRRAMCCRAFADEKGSPTDTGGTAGIKPSSSDPIDLSSATTFYVSVYDTQGYNTVQLKLCDDRGCPAPEEAVWSEMQSSHNQWAEITWPISAFTNVNTIRIRYIEIYEWNDGIYCFDAIGWQ
jgi:hypothetical protein